MQTRAVLGIGFLFCAALVFCSQVWAQGDEIEKRRLLMESNNEAATKSISKAAKEGNFTEVQVQAKAIMENMDKVPELFPKGSTSEKSRAKAEIWEKWDEFTKDAGQAKKAAEALADAAKAKNEADVNVKLKALGEACASCHKSFRAPRKSS